MTVPHLIHVGMPKTGSVYLRAWFEAHPEIAYSHERIAGYRTSRDMTIAIVRSGTPGCIVTSSEQFSTPARKRIDGSFAYDESANIGAERENCCRYLGALFPEAWVLIVTRGYEQMLRSSYSQFVRTGGDADFATLVGQDAPPQTAEVWNYDGIVALYRSVFASEKVIVLPYEMLRDNPEDFVREIERRLGLSHHAPPAVTMNRSLSRVELDWYPRMTKAMRRLPLPGRVRNRVLRRYMRTIYFGRLELVARLLERWCKRPAVDHTVDPELLLRTFAGKADGLREEPAFAPYLADYFIKP